MTDNSALGGLQPTGDRFERPRQQGQTQRQPASPPPGGSGQQPADSVDLTDVHLAAAELLMQRVLHFTRRLLPPCVPPPGSVFLGLAITEPAALAARIQAAQAWQAGGQAPPAALHEAFEVGCDETGVILAELGDQVHGTWLEQVRAAARGRTAN